MGRILFFALIALAVYLLWRWVSQRSRPDAAPPASTAARQSMVSCAACGLHLPQPDALRQADHYYCCEEHRARGPAAGR